jgi:hypothetical protein
VDIQIVEINVQTRVSSGDTTLDKSELLCSLYTALQISMDKPKVSVTSLRGINSS